MELPFDVKAAEAALASADPRMGEIIEAYGPCTMTITSLQSPFESLFKTIIFQQLSTASANAIFGRVLALFDGKAPTPDRTLVIADEAYRGAGMSKQKIRYVRDLAQKTLEGTVPEMAALAHLSDQEIIERLSAVHGIGRWTVEMLLMFNMGRPDILPTTDLVIRKAFQQIYNHEALPKPKAIDAFGERWRPYRSIASWYMWRVIDGDNDAW